MYVQGMEVKKQKKRGPPEVNGYQLEDKVVRPEHSEINLRIGSH